MKKSFPKKCRKIENHPDMTENFLIVTILWSFGLKNINLQEQSDLSLHCLSKKLLKSSIR